MRVYVASPYQIPQAYYREVTQGLDASDIAAFIEHRARAAKFATSRLQFHAYRQKINAWFYTPIGYEHSVILNELSDGPDAQHDMRMDHNYWLNMDLNILEAMQGMVILAMPGWTLSTGIRKEVEFMRELVGARIHVHVVGNIATVDPSVTKGTITIAQRLTKLDRQTDIKHYHDLIATLKYAATARQFA